MRVRAHIIIKNKCSLIKDTHYLNLNNIRPIEVLWPVWLKENIEIKINSDVTTYKHI